MSMLQLEHLHREAMRDLWPDAGALPDWQDGDTLEAVTDRAVAELRAARIRAAARRGPLHRAWEAIDRAIRTDEGEWLDDPDFPEATKLEMVRALHLFNRVVGVYPRYLAILEPWIRKAAAAGARPVRVLELASGSGELACALLREARRRGLDVAVTASDVVPGYVAAGRETAARRGLELEWRALDAFDLSALEDGAFDVAFVAQSIHHFGPGQLARVIAETRRVARQAFVAMDGRRSLANLALVPGLAAFALRRPHLHDATVTARRFYAEAELELVARIASRDRGVRVSSRPGLSVLEIAHAAVGG